MVSTERRFSAARYREAAPHYVALLVIAAAIIAVNLLWTHAQGGHGWLWRDATMGICFGRRCAPDQLNAQAAVALLAVAVLPALLANLPLVAPTRWLAALCRWLAVLGVASLLAYSIEELARLHRATVSIGGTAFSANGIPEVVALAAIGPIAISGLLLAAARRVRPER
jgi:hypothetical protein